MHKQLWQVLMQSLLQAWPSELAMSLWQAAMILRAKCNDAQWPTLLLSAI
jgi:hypothetical protein